VTAGTVPRVAPSPATLLGLFIALVVPILSYAIAQAAFGTAQSAARVATGLVVHWINLGLLIGVLALAERRPLSSIGLRPLRVWTIPAGIIAGVVIAMVSGALIGLFKLHADPQLVGYLLSLPLILRVLLVITAGVFEETLYRGYALERLADILGNRWLAAIVTVVLFTLAHAPVYGITHLAPVAVISVLITLLYLWRRDLVLNMVAHATVDALPLLLAPLLGGFRPH